MSDLKTIRMKLMTDNMPAYAHPLSLEFDPRHGQRMPYAIRHGKFLSDLREEVASMPKQPSLDKARSWAFVCHYETFWWDCAEHGLTAFFSSTGTCVSCSKKSRQTINPARRLATGSTYRDDCPVHGDVEFSKSRGLCLKCYNTLGKPRPASTNPAGWYVDRTGNQIPAPSK